MPPKDTNTLYLIMNVTKRVTSVFHGDNHYINNTIDLQKDGQTSILVSTFKVLGA